jgi:2,3-bisphosphoglycerate-dependent phosphoglycerate mutase
MILPKELFLIRHGESLANCARREAEQANEHEICFDGIESEVPLSKLGKIQVERLGQWFTNLESDQTIIKSSPYQRTKQTAEGIISTIDESIVKLVFDERLRERELGIFNRLTKAGARVKYPEECEKRELLGKFQYRPTNGESWADVASRVRRFLSDFAETIENQRVVIVTHEVVIHLFRYILENLSEAEILAIDCSRDIENGSITSYITKNGKISLELDNYQPK